METNEQIIETKPKTVPSDLHGVCEQIAQSLGETEAKPLEQIRKIVAALGAKRSLKLLQKSLTIEENGGMVIYNQARRRTLGGVYFFLAQRWIDKEHCFDIWPEMYPSHIPPLKWEDRKQLVDESMQEIGEANSVRAILIGRPGRVIEKGKVVLISMQALKHPQSWPKGLPQLPPETSAYVVYITAKQWRKVKEAIGNKQDELIIEGFPVYNPQLKAMTVFALRTTTKLLERVLREQQRSNMP